MKKILSAFLCLFVLAEIKAQCDTVQLSITDITATSARFRRVPTGPAGTTTLKYVKSGTTDTVSVAIGAFPVVITTLTPNTTYRAYISNLCVGVTYNTITKQTFTTAQQYTPMTAQGYDFKRVAIANMLHIPFVDTATAMTGAITRPGGLVMHTGDSTIYAWKGSRFVTVNPDVSEILDALDGKVDSVTTSGDSLFYWKAGVAYGQVFNFAPTFTVTDPLTYSGSVLGLDTTTLSGGWRSRGYNDTRYAPITGSGNYIQNQNGSPLAAQTGKFFISDTGQTNGIFRSVHPTYGDYTQMSFDKVQAELIGGGYSYLYYEGVATRGTNMDLSTDGTHDVRVTIGGTRRLNIYYTGELNIPTAYKPTASTAGTYDILTYKNSNGNIESITLANLRADIGTGVFVPYTGATTNVNLGSNNLTAGDITGAYGTFTNNLQIGAVGAGGKYIYFPYGTDLTSRSWRYVPDLTAPGDFSIQQSTTRTGGTYANALYFDASRNATFAANVSAAAGTFTGKIIQTTSTAPTTQGEMGYSSVYGSYLFPKAGSTDDWTVFNAAGSYLMHNPTGTANMVFAGEMLTTNKISSGNSFRLMDGATVKGGLYKYSVVAGSGTDYTPTLYAETGLGVNISVNGSSAVVANWSTGGNFTNTGSGLFGSKVLLTASDGTYGSGYSSIAFTGTATNGNNRIYAGNTNNDDIYIAAGTGRGVTLWVNGSSANVFRVNSAGNIEATGTFQTGAPSGYSAAPWKFGAYGGSGGTGVTGYIPIEVNGVVYFLALTTPPVPQP